MEIPAPAFVTSFTLVNEARSYDATGRLLEVGYGVSTPEFRIEDWPKFLEALPADTPAGRIVRAKRTPAQLESAEKLRQALGPAEAHLARMETQKTAAETASKGAEADKKESLEAALKTAREARDKAARERDALLDQQPAELPAPWKRHVPELLRGLAGPATFYLDHATDFPLPAAADGARKRLLALGIARESGTVFEMLPLFPGDTAPATRLSRYQSAELARFHGELVAAVLPGVKFESRQPLVDFRLTTPKNWRDVYQHDDAGEVIGWTRYGDTGTRTEFTADGLVVLTRDHVDRPDTAVPVTYGDAGDAAKRKRATPLTFTPHPPALRYEYRDDADRRGRVLPLSPKESGVPGEQ